MMGVVIGRHAGHRTRRRCRVGLASRTGHTGTQRRPQLGPGRGPGLGYPPTFHRQRGGVLPRRQDGGQRRQSERAAPQRPRRHPLGPRRGPQWTHQHPGVAPRRAQPVQRRLRRGHPPMGPPRPAAHQLGRPSRTGQVVGLVLTHRPAGGRIIRCDVVRPATRGRRIEPEAAPRWPGGRQRRTWSWSTR